MDKLFPIYVSTMLGIVGIGTSIECYRAIGDSRILDVIFFGVLSIIIIILIINANRKDDE